MAFYCKPSGGYALGTTEATNNIQEYAALFNFTTTNNIVGQLCNVKAESGLNPWRWQGDTVGANYGNGYGLYQFTPASGYINLTGVSGHSPNLSVSSISGGNESDAVAQIWVFQNNTLQKWVSRCWRPYWNYGNTWDGNPRYPDLYAKRATILNTYGDGSSLSMAQFYTIDNVEDACFAFLACFEGPYYPNLSERLTYAQDISDALGGGPVPPPPPPPVGSDDIINMLFLTQCIK